MFCSEGNSTLVGQTFNQFGQLLSSAPSVGYTYGLWLMSEKASGGNMLYYGYDGQGSVRMLVNGNTVEDTYDYDGYGNLIVSTGTDNNNYRYEGQQWDPNLGLYYLRARYYDPKLGRFWTGDTDEGDQEDPLSLHKYLYCAANPINRIDPTGHDPEVDVSVAGNLGAGIDAQVVPTIASRVYASVFNTLIRANLAQDQLILYVNATAGALAALGLAAEVTEQAAHRLANNTAAIPGGWGARGTFLEQEALGAEPGYLGGNVSYIDYFDGPTGLGISFRSHGLSANLPNLEGRLLYTIESDIHKMENVTTRGASGISAAGKQISINANQIKQTSLMVAIPASQESILLSETFIQTIARYEEFYKTTIEVLPVEGW